MATLVLQPDGTSGKDSWDNQILPHTNRATATVLSVGALSGFAETWHSWIEMDLSSIRGDAVTSATLQLYQATASDPATQFQVARLTEAWTEDQVTWADRQTGVGWGIEGGRFDPNVVDGPFTCPSSSTTIFSVSVINTVRYAVQQTQDGIWSVVLMPVTGFAANDGPASLASSDNTTAIFRPRLTVVHETDSGRRYFVAEQVVAGPGIVEAEASSRQGLARAEPAGACCAAARRPGGTDHKLRPGPIIRSAVISRTDP